MGTLDNTPIGSLFKYFQLKTSRKVKCINIFLTSILPIFPLIVALKVMPSRKTTAYKGHIRKNLCMAKVAILVCLLARLADSANPEATKKTGGP
jgi:hypothetical protein